MFLLDVETAQALTDILRSQLDSCVAIFNFDGRPLAEAESALDEQERNGAAEAGWCRTSESTTIAVYGPSGPLFFVRAGKSLGEKKEDLEFIRTICRLEYEEYVSGIADSPHAERSELINRIAASKDRIVSHHPERLPNVSSEMIAGLGYGTSAPRAACIFQFPLINTMEFESNAYFDYIYTKAAARNPYSGPDDIYGMLDNDKLLVLKSIPAGAGGNARKILRAFGEIVRENILRANGIDVSVGIGSAYPDPAGLQDSFDEADFMLNLGGGQPVRSVYDNVAKYLTSAAEGARFGDYYALLERSADGEGELLRTAAALSRNAGNAAKTAEELGIHRNTAAARIGRLKTRFGIDPDDGSGGRRRLFFFSRSLESRKTLRLGINIQKNNPQYVGCCEFARLVERMSDGKLAVSIHTAVSIGYKLQMADALKTGELDFAISGLYHLSPYTNRRSEAMDLPFLFADDAHAERALDGEPGETVAAEMERNGIDCLAYCTQGWRVISNSKRPVRVPEDLRGLKIRIRDNRTTESCFLSFAAVPVKLAYGDLYSALEQRIIDGQDNPYINFFAMGFGRHQGFICETRHHYDINAFLASKASLERLAVRERNIIREAAFLAKAAERTEAKRMNDEAKKRILAAGTTSIAEPTPAERRLWTENVARVLPREENRRLVAMIRDLGP